MAKKIQRFAPGEILVQENTISRKLFIIRRGKVRVYKNYFNQKVTLAILESGEVVGELSFFDSNPRSASVEAITDVEAIVIDGADDKQMEKIPSWVVSVLKNTFKRFRDMDQEITLLKSMYDFQKKSQQVDNVAKTLYMEILRANKTLLMLVAKHQQHNGATPFNWEEISAEMNDIMGKKYINLTKYLRELTKCEIIYSSEDELGYILNEPLLEKFTDYLNNQIAKQDYLLITQSALTILRSIIEASPERPAQSAANQDQLIHQKTFQTKHIPLFEEGLQELVELKLIKTTNEGIILFKPATIERHYTYQSILKNFDHSTLYPA